MVEYVDVVVEIGLIGFGIMGGNFVFNIVENGYQIVVFNCIVEKIDQFMDKVGDLVVKLVLLKILEDFVVLIKMFWVIVFMVQVGEVVDVQIIVLWFLLDFVDLIIDVGNVNYYDINCCVVDVEENGLRFMGMGVFGGEEGV